MNLNKKAKIKPYLYTVYISKNEIFKLETTSICDGYIEFKCYYPQNNFYYFFTVK